MNQARVVRVFSQATLLLAVSGLALFSGLACDQADAQAAAKTENVAATAPAAPAEVAPTAEQGEQAYDEESFALELHGPDSAKVGEVVELKILLAAKNGFKVNQEYPVKFQFTETPGVKPQKPMVRKEDGKVEKERFEIPASVILTEGGARSIEGKLSFSVCTDDRCLIEKRQLRLSITAS